MAETALFQLQHQIDAIRKKAFAEGYAAAMKAVRELASRSAPQQTDTTAAAVNGNGRGEDQPSLQPPNTAAVPLRTSTPVRRSPARRRTVRVAASDKRGSRGRRRQPGTNARMVQEILKTAAPRAVRQAQIRKALQAKGVTLAFPSIGHALGQLAARKAARQVGNSGSWRYATA